MSSGASRDENNPIGISKTQAQYASQIHIVNSTVSSVTPPPLLNAVNAPLLHRPLPLKRKRKQHKSKSSKRTARSRSDSQIDSSAEEDDWTSMTSTSDSEYEVPPQLKRLSSSAIAATKGTRAKANSQSQSVESKFNLQSQSQSQSQSQMHPPTLTKSALSCVPLPLFDHGSVPSSSIAASMPSLTIASSTDVSHDVSPRSNQHHAIKVESANVPQSETSDENNKKPPMLTANLASASSRQFENTPKPQQQQQCDSNSMSDSDSDSDGESLLKLQQEIDRMQAILNKQQQAKQQSGAIAPQNSAQQ
jgi:hypothetical protein